MKKACRLLCMLTILSILSMIAAPVLSDAVDIVKTETRTIESDVDSDGVNELFDIIGYDAPTSGSTWGIYWDYTEYDNTLRLSGSGDMENFEFVHQRVWTEDLWNVEDVETSSAPWAGYEFIGVPFNEINTVIIGPGITSIGDYAFFALPRLNTVIFENGADITRIGYSAFRRCEILSGIEFNAFINLREIGSEAFSDCYSITNIKFSENSQLETIGYSAFSSCPSLTDIDFGDNSNLREIGSSAFYNCFNLTSVDFGDNSVLEYIGDYGFQFCSALNNILLPDSVNNISYGAFYYCSNLTDIVIPSSITYIYDYVFAQCVSLTSINLENIVSIGSYAFQECKSLTVTLPDALNAIGIGAFSGCSSLINITIPPGVTVINTNTFYGCTNLTTIGLHNAITSIGSNAFQNCGKLELTELPSALLSIGQSAFQGCTGLINITIPSNVTSINNYTFSGCTGLTSIVLPGGITSIGNYAFQGCAALQLTQLPGSLISIGQNAFYGCANITLASLPVTLVTISNSAFYGCEKLTGIDLSSNVNLTTIGANAFQNCTGLVNISVPSKVTTINASTFNGCTVLTTITLHDGIVSIGNSAFQNCTNLALSALPPAITTIGTNAFQNCSKITLSQLPANVKIISAFAFQNCNKITLTQLPSEVTSIGDSAFSGCKGITISNFPSGLTSIGASAFAGCTGLSDISLPTGVQTLQTQTFANVEDLYIVLNRQTMVTATSTTFTASKDIVVFVPASLLDTYKSNSIWKSFTDVVIYPIANTYEVNVNSEHGDVTTSGSISRNTGNYYRTDEIITISVQTAPGYSFTGWTSEDNVIFGDAGSSTTTFQLPTPAPVTITANFVRTYDLTIQPSTLSIFTYNDGGTVEGAGKYVSQSTVAVKAIPNIASGYEFIRWTAVTNGGVFGDIYAAETTYTMPMDSDATITAVFGRRYTVTFDYSDATGGNDTDTKTVITAELYGDLPMPVKTGYNFVGWYTEASGAGGRITGDSTVRITENQTLYAYFELIPHTGYAYKVEHYKQDVSGNGYTLSDTDHLHGVSSEFVTAAYKSYAGFASNISYESTIASGTVLENGSLTLSLFYSRLTYTVTFDNGEVISAQTGVRYEATAVPPTAPTKSGYTFDGWYTDKTTLTNLYDFESKVTANVDLYAKWSENPTVSYAVEHLQQNITGDEYTVYETDELTARMNEQVTATHKSYTGFAPNAQLSDPSATIADNTIVLKLYYDRATYTVSFESNGGSVLAPQSGIRYQSTASIPSTPAKSGYTFDGWYTDTGLQAAYNFETAVTADFTLYAKWNIKSGSGGSTTSYTITVTGGEGGSITPTTIQVNRGDNQTFLISANNRYIISDVLVDGVSVGVVSSYEFKNVTANHTIEARFEESKQTVPESECPSIQFIDLDTTLWYHDSIDSVLKKSLMKGTSSITFAPNEYITRAQFVTIIARLSGVDLSNSAATSFFNDISSDTWYASAVNWGMASNIIIGYGNNTFAPEDAVTREQFVAMVYRYMDISNYETEENILSKYADSARISNWATEPMKWAIDVELIRGYNQGYLNPQGSTTRAEAAVILKRLLEDIIKGV